jgi:dipeptidyl aminopeptidase/acylaminoacyl peptidase
VIAVKHLPSAGGIVSGIGFARNAPYLSVSLTSPTRLPTAWRIDLRTGTAAEWTSPTLAGIDPASFVAPALIRFPSFDGREIPAFLYVPRDAKPDGTLPVVMDIHGGPRIPGATRLQPGNPVPRPSRLRVLAPNIRGSTGYGKAYTHLDDVEKRLDSIEDIVRGADWLVASGWADPAKIAVLGGSYGGYATLAALAFHPHRGRPASTSSASRTC